MSHTLTDDELPGADKGRAVNLIDKALANGWWWTREGRPDTIYAEVAIAAGAAAVEMADAHPEFTADLQRVDTFDPDPVVAVIDVPLDTIETAPIKRPRSSKR